MTARAAARPGARFIDPATLARIGNLELVAKTVVDGFIAGLHRAPYLGLSLDFAEHRAYHPGDDVRRIDWRLYARTDRYHVKEYEADTNADFTVVLDVSRSMGYASGGISKLDYARCLAATLTYFSHRQRDRVGMVAFADDVVERVPPSARHLDAVLHALDRLEPARRGALAAPLRRVAETLKRRGVVVVVSDFYEEPESAVAAVRRLRGRGGDVIVFHVLDPAELEFPFDRAATFRDLESGERIPVVPTELRARYRELIEAHTAALARRFADDGIDYALLNTATPLDHALFGYLSARHRLSRVR
ncbi:MAG TPA: DUF58 domain-containing protein [Longimicrobiales bacterium]